MSEDGIVQSVCEQPVFGTVKDLRVLPWNESRRSPIPQVFATLNVHLFALIFFLISVVTSHLLSLARIQVQTASKAVRTADCRY